MKTDEEIQKILDTAKQRGVASVVIDGVTYNLYREDIVTNIGTTKVVPDLEAKDLVVPGVEEFDDELIQYWSSPYYDILLAERKSKEERIKEEVHNG